MKFTVFFQKLLDSLEASKIKVQTLKRLCDVLCCRFSTCATQKVFW